VVVASHDPDILARADTTFLLQHGRLGLITKAAAA
jgi:hypothetical protein